MNTAAARNALLAGGVSLPWLGIDALGPLNLAAISALVVLTYFFFLERQTLEKAVALALSKPILLWGAGATLLFGGVLTLLIHENPFYDIEILVTIFGGFLIVLSTTSTFVSYSASESDRLLRNLTLAAVAAMPFLFVALPVVLGGAGPSVLFETLRTLNQDALIRVFFVEAARTVDASVLSVPVETRSANLRHEPALLLAALLPVASTLRTDRWTTFAGWVMLGLTLSRSAILAALLARALLALAEVLRGATIKTLLAWLLGFALAVPILGLTVGTALVDRFTGATDRSTEIRSDAVGFATENALTKPVGFALHELPSNFTPPHVYVLDAAIGAGLLGTFSAVALLFFYVHSLRVSFLRVSKTYDPVVALAVSASIVSIVRYFTAGSFIRSPIAWFAAGVLLVATADRVEASSAPQIVTSDFR